MVTDRNEKAHITKLKHLSIAVAIACGTDALAQQGTDADKRALEEVLVTAQKREQRLQDVPMSLSAFTAKDIVESGMVGVQDLAQMTPGLVFAETIGRQTTVPVIRGIAPFGFGDPTVVMMIDGYTNGFNRSGNNASLVDLERIEILRGPQPTLYGRNAIGGVINYISKKPGDEFRASFRGDAGTRGTYLAQGSVSGPLVEDVLAGGLALGYREFGGFMDNVVTGENDVNEEKDINARATLRFTPGDRLTVDLTADYNEADDAAGDPSHVPPAFFPPDPLSLIAVGQGAFDFNDFDRTISQDVLGGFDREESTIVLNASYDFGWAELTSITGTSSQETSIRTDVTRLPGPSPFGEYFDVAIDNDSWSEELRLASTGDGALTWLVGAFYFENQRDRLLTFDGNFTIQDTTGEVTNWALFANVEYALSERWSVIAGLRYDEEERKEKDNFQALEADSKFEEWLPSLSVSYKPSETMHYYATISRGYHAGGPNSFPSIAFGAPATYDPEYVTNYEVGAKGFLLDGKMSFEAALFYMDWEDQQIQNSFNELVGFIENAGGSEVTGLEFSAQYAPVDALELSLSFSVLDAEYTEFLSPLQAAPFGLSPDLSGNDMIQAPDFSGNLSAQYTLPLGDGWDMRLRADVNHVGERAFDTTNLLIADAYTTLDLYAGVRSDRLELGVFANNATDEDFLVGGILASVGFPPLLTVGDPSVFGLRVTVNY
ncbi:TonB-dependent receptor [Pseudohaliea sp.]|uniref:TonB-dependent receptor n=1 Tax=Pseudohaliea sp. TaxID=2740289 RepID=UPI0032ED2838